MATLLGAAEIREIAERIGLKPTKKLGQNFVVDANTCRRIVKAADVTSDDVALEIGPGIGSLTLALLEVSREVIAIEIDDRLAGELANTAAAHEFDTARLHVMNEDAMTTESLPKEPTVLVANLPYNISVPVLLHFLENLSSAGTVGRSIFWPVPNVDSSLVKFIRHAPAGDEEKRVQTFSVIDAAFAQRRKMLRSALGELFDGKASESIASAGIDPTVRGEVLLLGDFMKIANTLAI